MSKSAAKEAQAGERFDAATQARRAVLSKMEKMTPKEVFEVSVRAGIYTKSGKLTAAYRPPRSKR
jgi:hypothetical protein